MRTTKIFAREARAPPPSSMIQVETPLDKILHPPLGGGGGGGGCCPLSADSTIGRGGGGGVLTGLLHVGRSDGGLRVSAI